MFCWKSVQNSAFNRWGSYFLESAIHLKVNRGSCIGRKAEHGDTHPENNEEIVQEALKEIPGHLMHQEKAQLKCSYVPPHSQWLGVVGSTKKELLLPYWLYDLNSAMILGYRSFSCYLHLLCFCGQWGWIFQHPTDQREIEFPAVLIGKVSSGPLVSNTNEQQKCATAAAPLCTQGKAFGSRFDETITSDIDLHCLRKFFLSSIWRP